MGFSWGLELNPGVCGVPSEPAGAIRGSGLEAFSVAAKFTCSIGGYRVESGASSIEHRVGRKRVGLAYLCSDLSCFLPGSASWSLLSVWVY